MALYGHQHSFEQNLLRCDWAPDGSRVAAGSSDRIVYIWDAGEGTLDVKKILPACCQTVRNCHCIDHGNIVRSPHSPVTVSLHDYGELLLILVWHILMGMEVLPRNVHWCMKHSVLCPVVCDHVLTSPFSCCACSPCACAVSGEVQYALPGHKGSVNEVVFHPKEPIVGSCSNDRTLFLGELADS
jgi:WD40 repeat protein